MLDFIPEDSPPRPFFIAPEHGLHNAVRLTVQPLTQDEQDDFVDAGRESQPKAWKARCHALCAQRIKTWSIVDAHKQPLPITGANVRKLHPRLYSKLWPIVFGTSGGDQDPEASEAPQSGNELQAAEEKN